ncbi:hypothetical protein [Helicobacter aurati]|uniref:hypothetical protein n=1 Tax=Helicobacter aurati TaxID=137778 RepID=UPI000CF12065|nr:hypothetical protein [Helicobacter aurati]
MFRFAQHDKKINCHSESSPCHSVPICHSEALAEESHEMFRASPQHDKVNVCHSEGANATEESLKDSKEIFRLRLNMTKGKIGNVYPCGNEQVWARTSFVQSLRSRIAFFKCSV